MWLEEKVIISLALAHSRTKASSGCLMHININDNFITNNNNNNNFIYPRNPYH